MQFKSEEDKIVWVAAFLLGWFKGVVNPAGEADKALAHFRSRC